MAKYYAVVSDNYIQQDLKTGQLEIYETKRQANMNCPSTCKVIAVKVKKLGRYIGGPIDNTKPGWWEDEDYQPDEKSGFERTYFDS